MLVKLLLSAILIVGTVEAQKPLTRNVTYFPDDPAWQYSPSCASDNRTECRGAWWTEYDPKYGNGRVKVCGDPDEKFGKKEPSVEFTFRGKYQWINKTSSTQTCFSEGSSYVFNYVPGSDEPFYTNEEATLMPTCVKTGLEPGTHSFMIFHNKRIQGEFFMSIDHVVVEELLEEVPQSRSSPDKGRIIGASVAGTVLVLAILGLFYRYKRKQAAKAKRKAQADLVSHRDAQFTGVYAERQADGRQQAEARSEVFQTQKVESPNPELKSLPYSESAV
ncbi:hypothetical protein FRC03_007807 [Tulasnella sp. 419]|nr:hypothetical protein FRC03_007807 [Tulasnella sp. 419]